MEAFNDLRKAARARRDMLIEHARGECEKTVAQINTLEKSLYSDGKPEAPKSATSYLTNILPADRPFTGPDILRALETAHPWRMWSKHSIDSAINVLLHKGIIKRFSKRRVGKGREVVRASYIRVGAKIQSDDPFAETNLRDAIYSVLQGHTLTLVEVAVALTEAGYRTVMKPKALRDNVGRLLRADSRFVRDGGKWSCR
jgi:predicted transcriptional regulator